MGLFSKLNLGKISLKRKEGGSFVGNMLRSAVHNESQGEFGNGALKLQPNETPQQADERLIKGLGAAAISFNETAGNTSSSGEKPKDAFKLGATLEKFKSLYPIVGGGLLLLIVLIFALKKHK